MYFDKEQSGCGTRVGDTEKVSQPSREMVQTRREPHMKTPFAAWKGVQTCQKKRFGLSYLSLQHPLDAFWGSSARSDLESRGPLEARDGEKVTTVVFLWGLSLSGQ